eukprot:154836-Prorocentrum_lima.AAC.1
MRQEEIGMGAHLLKLHNQRQHAAEGALLAASVVDVTPDPPEYGRGPHTQVAWQPEAALASLVPAAAGAGLVASADELRLGERQDVLVDQLLLLREA